MSFFICLELGNLHISFMIVWLISVKLCVNGLRNNQSPPSDLSTAASKLQAHFVPIKDSSSKGQALSMFYDKFVKPPSCQPTICCYVVVAAAYIF